MKYENDLHLFSTKLSKLMIKNNMIDKKGKPDIIALYNTLYPNDKITDELCRTDRQKVTDKTRFISNWLRGNNYPKNISDVLELCNALNCDLDYFFSTMEAPTHDLKFISEKTNLSYDAIDMLIKNKKSDFPFIVDTINFLLENDKYIDDKVELLRLITHYVLLSKNIKSYDECDVSLMKNKNIFLRDEYGAAAGIVPVDKMSNIFLLSINEILTRLRDNIDSCNSIKRPTIFDILDDMLFDLLRLEDIRQRINGFNFDIDELSRINRRFKENKKRLIYLYDCNNINDIDFEKFKLEYPKYSDEDIKLLQKELNL